MRVIVAIVVGVALVIGAVVFWRSPAPVDTAWGSYKQRFVGPDGRVMDTGNGNVSHTEGQGYAMLLAVAHDDRATFDRVWGWTRDTLRRPDGLYSWRYTPGAEKPVADLNNATDGDLVMCWALLRAAAAWNRPADRDAALTLAAAMKPLIVRDGTEAYLLPGIDGFVGDGKRVVNLSYWVYPALKAIAATTNDAAWNDVAATGARLVEKARFGDHKLPPDWLETAGTLRPADGFPPRFGYDAIRIPLYLIWGGYGDAAHLDAISAFWRERGSAGAPAWIDLTTGDVSPEKQSPGMAAVKQLTLGEAKSPSVTTDDYYSTSLRMLTALAEKERAAR